jgi:hypothetical protein
MKPRWILLAFIIFSSLRVWAWGPPHAYISQTAVDLLPAWQKTLLGDQIKPFVRDYCYFPDRAFQPSVRPYIMPAPAGVKALLHLPASLEQNKLVFDYYLPRAVELLRQGNTAEAMKYFGCAAHYIEDSNCPAHFRYGETAVPEGGPMLSQPDFIRGLMPLPESADMEWFHSRLDNCPFTLAQLKSAVGSYRPRLLGGSMEELIFNVVEQHCQMNARAQRHLIPMMEAIGANNMAKFKAEGAAAAKGGARLLTDVLYTVLCLAQNRFETKLPAEVSLAGFTPARGSPFSWSDKNHQGRFIRNASGSWFASAGEFKSLGRHPLKLKMGDGSVRAFKKGFGVGWKTETSEAGTKDKGMETEESFLCLHSFDSTTRQPGGETLSQHAQHFAETKRIHLPRAHRRLRVLHRLGRQRRHLRRRQHEHLRGADQRPACRHFREDARLGKGRAVAASAAHDSHQPHAPGEIRLPSQQHPRRVGRAGAEEASVSRV